MGVFKSCILKIMKGLSATWKEKCNNCYKSLPTNEMYLCMKTGEYTCDPCLGLRPGRKVLNMKPPAPPAGIGDRTASGSRGILA